MILIAIIIAVVFFMIGFVVGVIAFLNMFYSKNSRFHISRGDDYDWGNHNLGDLN